MRSAIAVEKGTYNTEGRIKTAQLGQGHAANSQARFRARNVEKTGAIGVANADILNSLTLRSCSEAGTQTMQCPSKPRPNPEELAYSAS